MSDGRQVVEEVNGEWRKPVVVNDWGYLGYFLKATKSAHGTWGISEQDKSQQINAGDRLRVLWPDGSETPEVVSGRSKTERVSDMGHSYDVTSTRLVISTTAHGVKADFPIEELWVKRAQ